MSVGRIEHRISGFRTDQRINWAASHQDSRPIVWLEEESVMFSVSLGECYSKYRDR